MYHYYYHSPQLFNHFEKKLPNTGLIYDKLLSEGDREIYELFQQQKQIRWQQARDTDEAIIRQLKDGVIFEDDQTVPATLASCQSNLNDGELSEELKMTLDCSTKQQSVNQLANSSQFLNSQQSTQDVFNFKNEEDEKYGAIESDNSNKSQPGQDFSLYIPTTNLSENGNESGSVNETQLSFQDFTLNQSLMEQCQNETIIKEQVNQGQPRIDLKKAIQPYVCYCKIEFQSASSIRNHVVRMQKKGDKRQHGTIPRNVLQGRPKKLTKQINKLIKQIWKKELQGTQNSSKEVVEILKIFQNQINKISQENCKDQAIIHQLEIDKMRLREFFFELPINDADQFIQKFVAYRRLKGVKSTLMQGKNQKNDKKEESAFNLKPSTQYLAQERLLDDYN